MNKVEVFADPATLAQAAAEHIVTLATAAIAAHGRFSIGLSGGTTPRMLYTLLATDRFAGRIDWPNVHVFWGDERCVPPDHPDSNYRMARESLLDHVPLPEENIHRMCGELDPAEAAADYEQQLRSFFDPPTARFDLLLLGMGNDGHTASLFPGTAALHEQTRWVIENYVDKLNAWRITLTPPAINAATNITFMVTGQGKADPLRAVLTGPSQPERYPAQLVQPDSGQVTWLVDSSAAALLPD